jgi:hypothetical protein
VPNAAFRMQHLAHTTQRPRQSTRTRQARLSGLAQSGGCRALPRGRCRGMQGASTSTNSQRNRTWQPPLPAVAWGGYTRAGQGQSGSTQTSAPRAGKNRSSAPDSLHTSQHQARAPLRRHVCGPARRATQNSGLVGCNRSVVKYV